MFLPLRFAEAAVPVATHVRSTALGASLKALDAKGLRARYAAHLAHLAPHARARPLTASHRARGRISNYRVPITVQSTR